METVVYCDRCGGMAAIVKQLPGDTYESIIQKGLTAYLVIDEMLGAYKIGRSSNPSTRETTLLADKPSLRMIGAWKGVKTDESELHRKFKTKRIRGEWFNLTVEDVEEIKRYFEGAEEWPMSI